MKRIFFSALCAGVFFILSSCASGAPARYSMDSAVARESVELSDDFSSARMITYSVTLELSVKNTENTKNALLDMVKTNNGFIVRETDFAVTTRIPSANMDAFVNHAKTLGSIENEYKTGTDITDQYRDNVIRLENLKNVRTRYLELLNKANAVSDILMIEKELERVNTEIEIYEGRIKYAELSVSYSNITVRFREKTKPGPVGWIFYGLFRGIKWLFVW